MDLLVPADRILQPFVSRESQRYFNVRADVGLPDALVEVGDEDDGGELFNEGAVSGFGVGRGFGWRGPGGRISIDGNLTGKLGQKRFRLMHPSPLIEERVQRLTSQVKRRAGEGAAQQVTTPHRSVLEVRVALPETVSSRADLTGGMRDMSKFLKYAALLAPVAGVIANLPDIKRYIEMSSM
jgi:hypothetical protein